MYYLIDCMCYLSAATGCASPAKDDSSPVTRESPRRASRAVSAPETASAANGTRVDLKTASAAKRYNGENKIKIETI